MWSPVVLARGPVEEVSELATMNPLLYVAIPGRPCDHSRRAVQLPLAAPTCVMF
jgi:hypothetical protein